MYYPGVSLAGMGVPLGSAKQRQDLILAMPASEVIGPNAEAETFNAVICLGNREI